MAFPTPFLRRTEYLRLILFLVRRPTLAWHSMVISIAVFSLIIVGNLFLVSTWWVFLPKFFWLKKTGQLLLAIPASFGIRKTLLANAEARLLFQRLGTLCEGCYEKFESDLWWRDVSASLLQGFFYCDSGIIPWLVVWEYLSVSNLSLADLIFERKNQFLLAES